MLLLQLPPPHTTRFSQHIRPTLPSIPTAHSVLAAAGGDLAPGGDAELGPRLLREGLYGRTAVPQDEPDRLGGHVHGRNLRLRGGGDTPCDLR